MLNEHCLIKVIDEVNNEGKDALVYAVDDTGVVYLIRGFKNIYEAEMEDGKGWYKFNSFDENNTQIIEKKKMSSMYLSWLKVEISKFPEKNVVYAPESYTYEGFACMFCNGYSYNDCYPFRGETCRIMDNIFDFLTEFIPAEQYFDSGELTADSHPFASDTE